jgi:hypothetical protein
VKTYYLNLNNLLDASLAIPALLNKLFLATEVDKDLMACVAVGTCK